MSGGCYSFKGFSIDPEIDTFYVANFGNTTVNSPPTINQTFGESLKNKVARESRLNYEDSDPDIEFGGSITRYTVRAVSPERGERTALNRLDITVSIEYTNNRDEEESWKSSFNFFRDFDSTINLLDVQDQLIEEIFDQIIEDIFNKAFTNW